MVAVAGPLAAEGSFRHQDFWRDCMGSKEAEAVLFEDRGNTLEQMIVAAAKDAVDSRQQAQRLEIRPDLPDRRPHHRADENHIAAALLAGKPADGRVAAALCRDRIESLAKRSGAEKHRLIGPPQPMDISLA